MIVGIGVDQIEMVRIASSKERFGARFIKRIYTDAEYALALQKGETRRLAMFFAAKEAVAKALGTGFYGFSMRDIEVYFMDSGQPQIRLHGGAKQCADAQGASTIHLSLSDDAGMALAFAVAEHR